jgi:heptaprenyl diphosphate synthase
VSLSTFGASWQDEGFESYLGGRLEVVEERLATAMDTKEPFIAEAATHLLRAGGKRFRPLLVLLCAEFGEPDADGIVPAALVVELTHLATLYHDDVMDEAALRRGAQSANARWDNSIAILIGDYLFAQASRILSTLGTEAVRLQAETFSRLVQGQLRETTGPRDGEDPLQHYLSVVADKTGALIATSAQFGAMMSGASDAVQHALTEYGERIGSAFQLSDDIIDVASESDDSGKTPGTDLREGIPTLPTLIASASDAPEDARLRELLSGPIGSEADHAEALRLLRAHRSLDESRAFVRRRADEARSLLADVPAGRARDALESLCDTVVTRIG